MDNRSPISLQSLRPFDKKSSSSKYDFVKVRVWLGDHFFVLSRFLVSRILMVTKVPYDDAIKITLELKKRLVDSGRLDVLYSNMEDQLFDILRERHYGHEYISRFRMMNMFHNERVPLIILLGGTDCIGKSTLARLLAEQLNLPSVIHTDLVYNLLRNLVGKFQRTPIVQRHFDDSNDLIQEYRRECALVRMGLYSDLQKCVREGKSLIIEGFHLDPTFYEGLLRHTSGAEGGDVNHQHLDLKLAKQVAGEGGIPSISESADALQKPSAPTHSPASPIAIHFTLTLSESQHRHCTQNWADAALERDGQCLSSLDTDEPSPDDDLNRVSERRQAKLLANLRTVQRYLEGPVSSLAHVVRVNTHHFGETLGVLHDVVLSRITDYFNEGNEGNASGDLEPQSSVSQPQ